MRPHAAPLQGARANARLVVLARPTYPRIPVQPSKRRRSTSTPVLRRSTSTPVLRRSTSTPILKPPLAFASLVPSVWRAGAGERRRHPRLRRWLWRQIRRLRQDRRQRPRRPPHLPVRQGAPERRPWQLDQVELDQGVRLWGGPTLVISYNSCSQLQLLLSAPAHVISSSSCYQLQLMLSAPTLVLSSSSCSQLQLLLSAPAHVSHECSDSSTPRCVSRVCRSSCATVTASPSSASRRRRRRSACSPPLKRSLTSALLTLRN